MRNLEKFLALSAGMLALSGYPYIGDGRYPTPEPSEPTERQRQLFREHKTLQEFTIKGHKIMAYSKKDAMTRLIHQGKLKKKKKK